MSINNISKSEALMKRLDINGDGVVDKKDDLDEKIRKELGLNEGKTYTKENIEDISDKLTELGVKVENLTHGAEKPQMGVLKPQKDEAPSTGGLYAEYNPEDGTTLQYNYKEGTVKKYDKEGKVIFEKSIKEHNRQIRQMIEDKIKNLKPGESMQYEETISARLPGGSSKTENTVTVTRKENGELVERRLGVVRKITFPSIKGVVLNTTYDENYENKISEDFVDPRKNQWGVVSTKHYKDGKESSVTTDLSKIDERIDAFSILNSLSRSNKYSSQQLKNANGEVVLTVKDGKFYNAKGKEIDDGKAYDLIQKLRDNKGLGELIQEY